MYDLIGWFLFVLVYMMLIILEYCKALIDFCILTHVHVVVTLLGAENTAFILFTFNLDVASTTVFLITTCVKLNPKEVQKKHNKSLSKIN